MSEQIIVNRVSQNFVQDELAKLEPPTVDEQPVYDVLTGQTKSREDWSMSQPAVDAGHVQTTGGVPSEEFPEDNIGNTASVLNTLIVSRVEFDKFRAQVIMALKHQGIDVRKYFPE